MEFVIDMDLINQINKKYNFKIKKVRDDLIMISTNTFDSWIIELSSYADGKNIVLKHKNNGKNKDKWHTQRRFYDYTWAFGHMAYHTKKYLCDTEQNTLGDRQ